MGWRETVANWLAPQGYGDTRPEDPKRSLQYLPLPVSAAGLTLTMESATQLSVVWACIDVITKAVASSEWHVYEREGDDMNRSVDDPLEWLLNVRPNPEMTAIAWREAMSYSTLTWGNAYSEIVRSRSGKVTELWPLLSNRMWPTRRISEDGKAELEYWYYNWSGGWTILRPSQVLHFRGPTINGLMGENMIARGARAIGLAMAQERFASSYFANGATMGTILKYPKTLSEPAYKRLKEDWIEKHGGPDRAHKPFILEGGMEMEELTRNVEETSLTPSRVFSVEEICRFWGVPPHKVQHLMRATFNNIEHLGIEFVRDAVTPWVRRFCQEVDYKVFPQRAPWRNSNIDTDWLMHGDSKSRWEAYAVGRRIGVLSANDILRKEKMNTIGADGEVRLVESNMTTLEGIEQLVEKTKAEVKKAKEPTPAPVLPGAPGQKQLPPGKEAPEAPEPASAPEALRASLELLVGGSVERYTKKLFNREKDLRRKASRPEEEILASMAELRAESRELLLEELQEPFDLLKRIGKAAASDLVPQVLLTLDSLENGKVDLDSAVTAILSAAGA